MKTCCLIFWLALSAFAFGVDYYVDESRPDDSADGLSWSTAKKTLQGAVDAASDGDSITVTDGVYSVSTYLGNVVTIDKQLDIRSISGAEKTLIDGQQSNRCVSVGTAYTNTILRGFSLVNGYMTNAAAGAFGGTYVDCIFRGHRLLETVSSAPAIGAGAMSARLIHCTLTDNESAVAAAAAFCYLDRCHVVSNTCEIWGVLLDCTVRNSLIAHNRSDYTNSNDDIPSAAYKSSLVNCTVVYNEGCYTLSRCSIYNCIVYYNGRTSGALHDTPATKAFFSCTPDVLHGLNGNITNDPGIMDGRHLSAASPCAQAGSGYYTTGLDLDGEPWDYTPPMGCDQPLSLFGTLSAAISTPSTCCAAGYNLPLSCTASGLIVSNHWTLGNGDTRDNMADFTYAWNTAGVYTVTVELWNYSGSIQAQTEITVVDQLFFMWTPTAPMPCPPMQPEKRRQLTYRMPWRWRSSPEVSYSWKTACIRPAAA